MTGTSGRRGIGQRRERDRSRLRRIVSALALAVGCAPDATVTGPLPREAAEPSEEGMILPIPTEIGVDEEAAALGARLFADPAVSHDGTVACTSCHDMASGGDYEGVVTELPGRDRGGINVPTVFNVRFQFRWSWSGRWSAMYDQIDAAMRAPHAMATETEDAVVALRPAYEADFRRVFPDEGFTARTFRQALTEYLYSLTTPGSPFDRFLLGDEGAIDADARAGWDAFRSYGCVSCHQGTNVGGNLFQRFGVMEDYFAGREPTRADLGRFAVTDDEADRHVFRVPSLRNVALTAPYFHDGSAATLEDAVQEMARYQLGRELTAEDVTYLVAFLRSLTGTLRAPGGSP